MKHILFLLGFMAATFPSASKACSDHVLEELVSCPPWLELGEPDVTAREEFIEVMTDLARYDDVVIRSALQKYYTAYITPKLRANGWRLSLFNLLIFNRILFDVPSTVTTKEFEDGDFASWSSMTRTDGDNVNVLWPLEVGADGKLLLVGSMGFYNGSAPDPLREFDFFKAKYGRRKRGEPHKPTGMIRGPW